MSTLSTRHRTQDPRQSAWDNQEETDMNTTERANAKRQAFRAKLDKIARKNEAAKKGKK